MDCIGEVALHPSAVIFYYGREIEVTTRSEYIDELSRVQRVLAGLSELKVNKILIDDKKKLKEAIKQIREIKKQVTILHNLIFDGTDNLYLDWEKI
jgi:hypothetical protein